MEECKKISYGKKEAKKALKDYNSGPYSEKMLKRIYFCEECRAYHLTSVENWTPKPKDNAAAA